MCKQKSNGNARYTVTWVLCFCPYRPAQRKKRWAPRTPHNRQYTLTGSVTITTLFLLTADLRRLTHYATLHTVPAVDIISRTQQVSNESKCVIRHVWETDYKSNKIIKYIPKIFYYLWFFKKNKNQFCFRTNQMTSENIRPILSHLLTYIHYE